MKQERVILSFIMVLIGLLVAGAAFYFYQTTKIVPSSKTSITQTQSLTPTPKTTVFLSLNDPNNEEVVDNKTLTIDGQTNQNSTIIIITSSDQQVIQPSSQGSFSTTITLNDGENLINIIAVLPDGERSSLQRTVTYSTQSF